MARERMDLLAALASYRASVRGRDPLRDRYGERWPQVRERIFEVCQAFIQRRIGPGDMVMRAATGCARPAQLNAALNAGIQYLSGPVVGPMARTLCAPYPFDPTAAANLAPALPKRTPS